jgi:hypothetical protein
MLTPAAVKLLRDFGLDSDAESIRALPTIAAAHWDDLKIEVPGKVRVWVSRMTKKDGAPRDHEITVEYRISTGWKESQ